MIAAANAHIRGVRRAGLRTWFSVLLAVVIGATCLQAAEVIPPAPNDHFNDYAGVVSKTVAEELDRKLAAFEQAESSQIVVAVFRKMQSTSDVDDYTTRVAESWKVGLKEQDNGAVLFVFVEDRLISIKTGYGLEGAIPDAIAKDIIETRIKPHFRNGNFDAGLTAGVDALLGAARGEYQGTGRTFKRGQDVRRPNIVGTILFVAFVLLVISSTRSKRRGGHTYGRGGRSIHGPMWWGGGGWGGGGGGWGGGGGFGGGGFSGGGGSFGGGGASGRW